MIHSEIKPGHHDTGTPYKACYYPKGYTQNFKISSGWLTDLKDARLNRQSSKIGGTSFGILPHNFLTPAHHWNSSRVAIRPTTYKNNGIDLTGMADYMCYHYNNGILKAGKVAEFDPTKDASMTVLFQKSAGLISYRAWTMTKYKDFPFNWKGVQANGYMLYPYYGGDAVAPVLLTCDSEIIPL